ENNLKGSRVESSIVGIGLNINQSIFEGFKGTSLFLEIGRKLEVREVLLTFALQFDAIWNSIENGLLEGIAPLYFKSMLGYKQIRKYEDNVGVFIGIIEGVSPSGKLVIYRNGDLKEYDLKELKFIW
ncbi:MAG: hypothetical protein KJ941_08955, partial [Bacteroidetes bacterium]|nr:hypothetical protein [Bacteroidota bacterium]